ncbi:malate synthase G [Microbacterium sp. LRZ72]|uniref:malate synthase G n=1 Tax=Microbacterium sp. LRZ72 TaxID=2942481 RepID=UPI0029B6E0C2|nr:malate synthase G [Microbacterium sp. LRZ72]MDX2376571.1 malate synthase G [Microbacterium sp. LRZ72]
MTDYIHAGGLRIARPLFDFISDEALDAGTSPGEFWAGVASAIRDLAPRRASLLAERDRLQQSLDAWHRAHRDETHGGDLQEYRAHLSDIGYLVPHDDAPAPLTTTHVAAELSTMAGPQLVVPVTNPRYALNAVNARWGSLYDALYGTDAILPPDPTATGYDVARGDEVVAHVRELLDEVVPLAEGSHARSRAYAVADGALRVTLDDGRTTTLADAGQLRGFRGRPEQPSAVLLVRHGLHLELRFDADAAVGSRDTASLDDVHVESALSTIVDFEDSVAVVDAEDKVAAYRVWLGLNRGDLTHTFEKQGRVVERALADDRHYVDPAGEPLAVPGRALMLVRNVGLHMSTDAILDADGEPVSETILDAVVTTLCARQRLLSSVDDTEPSAALTIVMPKLHGPVEVSFIVDLLGRVEQLLGLPTETLKLGLMDEERRTSANLAACLSQASSRLAFINTGFLDRSGDEIHTSMQAGPFLPKGQLRDQSWMRAYERRNVTIGLAAGFAGRAQIGKGMWAMPDRMSAMLTEKITHPLAGASTAWVPSPTAATLHALHYLRVDVFDRQRALQHEGVDPLDDLLTIPVGDPATWTADSIRGELENNLQSILGYVVRWVDQGVGCSTVPDIDGVGLMEDRATLRISSQHIANWLVHGVVSAEEVRTAMERMAAVVDAQNAGLAGYRPMTADLSESVAYHAALALVFGGTAHSNGYTETVLHGYRRAAKKRDRAGAPAPPAHG